MMSKPFFDLETYEKSQVTAKGGWTSVEDALPPDETPVLVFLNGSIDVGELRWEHPGWEDTYQSFRYWDNPNDDGKCWEWHNITHWMPLPPVPMGANSESRKDLCSELSIAISVVEERATLVIAQSKDNGSVVVVHTGTYGLGDSSDCFSVMNGGE